MSMHTQNMHQPQLQPQPQQPHQPQSNMSQAKWHIPQSAQQSNGNGNMQPSQSSLAMQFGAKATQNYKISLKSPISLKPSGQQNGATSSINTVSNNSSNNNTTNNNNTNHLSQISNEIPSTVTSTNPKTPSPSTNDVRNMTNEKESEKKMKYL